MDQDDFKGSSINDLFGVGIVNGISLEKAKAYKKQMANANLQCDIAASCYQTFYSKLYENEYFNTTKAKGQVANVKQNSVCFNGEVQTLCYALGISMGTCQQEGFKGVGLLCLPTCNDTKAIVIAWNSNLYQ